MFGQNYLTAAYTTIKMYQNTGVPYHVPQYQGKKPLDSRLFHLKKKKINKKRLFN